ncbi:MAG: hypothetical protein V4662_20600 [Verrucomicrobiota bacterium]
MRRAPGPLKATTVDKNKVKSLFEKAKGQSSPKKNSSAGVATQSAEGTSKSESKPKPRVVQTPPSKKGGTLKVDKEEVRKPELKNRVDDAPPPPHPPEADIGESRTFKQEGSLPTIGADDVALFPNVAPKVLDLGIYQQVPERPGVELPTGGPQLPGTGMPGDSGIGGLRGGLQGGLTRPDLNQNTGEEHYERGFPGASDPATSPSGAMGDAGGLLGTAGQAVGGKTGQRMEQAGGLLQSESGAQALGRGANILLPGSGSIVEAAAKGDTQGAVNAGATAAGNLASDLAIGLIVGFLGGGLLGMAIGYALSATGVSGMIADGVSAAVKWVAEKVGVGGGEPAPAEPAPEPDPPPDSGSYDENYSKQNGKKGPSVVNENQVKPLQDKMKRDLLGENRDAEAFVDSSDAPAPGKVAVMPGCDPENLGGRVGGAFDPNSPLQIKDMERPGYDKS